MIKKMLGKISLQMKFTILVASLLIGCCIGLTFVLNVSTYNLVDKIDAAIITKPSQKMDESTFTEDWSQIIPNNNLPPADLTFSKEATAAKKSYITESIFYMIIFVLIGSVLTYILVDNTLMPLKKLNSEIKNMTVNNLSKTLEVPKNNDEITDLAKSFNEMTDKLNNAFLMQKRFSMSAAHELATPLAVIQTKLDVFLKKERTDEEYEALIKDFDKQIKRLRSLVKSLLDMTNMDDENEFTNTEIKELLNDIIIDLSSIAKKKNIVLSLDCEDLSMFSNVDLIYRSLYNLIENAIKYNEENGYVKVNAFLNDKKHIIIKIIDNGIGINEDMKEHIFEPFFRVDKSRSRSLGGAGLGLAITENIIKKHNGKITILDNDDKGTIFELEFLNSSPQK